MLYAWSVLLQPKRKQHQRPLYELRVSTMLTLKTSSQSSN